MLLTEALIHEYSFLTGSVQCTMMIVIFIILKSRCQSVPLQQWREYWRSWVREITSLFIVQPTIGGFYQTHAHGHILIILPHINLISFWESGSSLSSIVTSKYCAQFICSSQVLLPKEEKQLVKSLVKMGKEGSIIFDRHFFTLVGGNLKSDQKTNLQIFYISTCIFSIGKYFVEKICER